jgi:YggT family protein
MAWLLLYYTLEIFKWLIIARALMSWFVSPHTRNPVADFLRKVTDPVLRPISKMMPLAGGIDLSPIIAFFALTLLQQLIFR